MSYSWPVSEDWSPGKRLHEYVYPRVKYVLPRGPAARAGLVRGDLLVAVNGKDGREGALFPDYTPGATYRVRIRRGADEREVLLRVEPTPPGPPRP